MTTRHERTALTPGPSPTRGEGRKTPASPRPPRQWSLLAGDGDAATAHGVCGVLSPLLAEDRTWPPHTACAAYCRLSWRETGRGHRTRRVRRTVASPGGRQDAATAHGVCGVLSALARRARGSRSHALRRRPRGLIVRLTLRAARSEPTPGRQRNCLRGLLAFFPSFHAYRENTAWIPTS